MMIRTRSRSRHDWWRSAPPPSRASRAAGAPRLKELVSVSSEIVRIGDLVENAGAVADVPVFRAPDLGQTGAVPVAQHRRGGARPMTSPGLDTGGLTEVVVTRLSRALTAQGHHRAHRARASPASTASATRRTSRVIFDRDIRMLHVEPTATGDLMVSRMNVDQRTGRFDISFELPGSAMARRSSLRFTGSVTETVEAATLTRVAPRRATSSRPPTSWSSGGRRSSCAATACPVEQAVGMAAKSQLRSGQALRSRRPDQAADRAAQRGRHHHLRGARHHAHRARQGGRSRRRWAT